MNPMKPMNSMSRLLCLMVVLLAGCATGAPQASGAYRALNPGRWQPALEDLQGVRAPPSPAFKTPGGRP